MSMDSYILFNKEELRRLYYEERLTHEQMAERLFCSVSTVRKYMRHFGLIGRGAKERKVLERYKIGDEMLTTKEISERAGVNISTIRSRISRGWTGEALLQKTGEAFEAGMRERERRRNG